MTAAQPAMPAPTGPNAQKARFFAEVASAFELLALFHALTPAEQTEFTQFVRGLGAAAGSRP